MAGAGPLAAQTVPSDAAQMRLSFAPIVRRAAPAVVNVYSRRVVRQAVDPFFRCSAAAWACRASASPSRSAPASIVRPDGVIVTNNHVIEGGQDIMVVLGDRREFAGQGAARRRRAPTSRC